MYTNHHLIILAILAFSIGVALACLTQLIVESRKSKSQYSKRQLNGHVSFLEDTAKQAKFHGRSHVEVSVKWLTRQRDIVANFRDTL